MNTNMKTNSQLVALEVYNNPGHENHGKTFRIINNYLTLPHDVDHVYVQHNGNKYEATIGSYRNGGSTLRGANSIKELIEQNHWPAGKTIPCKFTNQGQSHIYVIE